MATAPTPITTRSAEDGAVDVAAVVRRAQLGSGAAFEQLVVLYGPRLFGFLVVRLGGERDARDALQETLVAAWQGLPTLADRDKIWPWLAGIAAHKAADARRRRSAVAEVAEADAVTRDADLALDFRCALDALPDAWREVLLLRYVLHLSEEETADALGVRVGTVKSRASRARRRLEELLG